MLKALSRPNPIHNIHRQSSSNKVLRLALLMKPNLRFGRAGFVPVKQFFVSCAGYKTSGKSKEKEPPIKTVLTFQYLTVLGLRILCFQ